MRSTQHLTHMQFKTPGATDGRGNKIEHIIVREVDGDDETVAAKMADANDSNIPVELIRLSLVSVNGLTVDQPFLEMDHWTHKARNYLSRAYSRLNMLADEEEKAFEEGSKVVAAPAAVLPATLPERADDDGVVAMKSRGR